MTDKERIRRAAARYGPSVDHLARKRYHISGQELLLKLVQGESNYDRHALSGAGARGFAQFMPATRTDMIRRFGIDPWRSPDEAVHAATLHLRGKLGHARGLEGYNPGGGQEYVRYILGQNVGRVPQVAAGGAVAGGATSQVPQASGFNAGPGGLAQKLTLVQPARVESVGLESPAFSAGPVMPQGYQAPQAGSVTPPLKLELPTPVGQQVDLGGPQQPAAGAAPSGQGPQGSGGQALGKIKIIGPNPGRIQPPVRQFMQQIAGVAGETIVASDGTGHDKYTVNGNISEHYTGNASDIPAAGKHLTRLGQAALIAAGVKPRTARKMRGGIYNVNSRGQIVPAGAPRTYQIIFNTNAGGNHWNHLHVGVR